MKAVSKMANLLLLYLDAPMQSWGLRARWDVRDTGDEPSKSGVIGLLGCAFGYPTGDLRLQDLDRRLRMGVRVERPGSKHVDFQTVTGVMRMADGKFKGRPDDPNTIISPRTYIHDASFLVALEGSHEVTEQCVEALRNPKWPIYLGRKACVPSRPVLLELTDRYSSIEEAFEGYLWEERTKDESHPKRLRCVIEDEDGDRIRQDRLESSPARMYGYRTVRVGWVDFPGVLTIDEALACEG